MTTGKAGENRHPGVAILVALLTLSAILFIASSILAAGGEVRADEEPGFKIKVTFADGTSPILIPVRVEGSRISGTYSGPASDPLGRSLYARVSFQGTMDSGQITGRMVSHAEETVNGNKTIYDGELSGVVLTIEGDRASSEWYTMTNRYRDSATGQGGTYPLTLRFTADLAPLVESGYEFAPGSAEEGEELEPTEEETAAQGGEKAAGTSAEKDEKGAEGSAGIAIASLVAATAAVSALLSASWKTLTGAAFAIGHFFSKPLPPGLEVPPPPPDTVEAESPPESAPAGQEAPREPAGGEEAPVEPPGPEPARQPEAKKEFTTPPREKTAADHLAAWERESGRYMRMFENGQLSYDDFTRLRAWRLYDRVPMEEIEIRARLMVLTKKEYMEFYNTIAGGIIDNVAEGILWEQAARVHPVAKTISQLKDLASMPYDIITAFNEYKDAAAAEAVLNEFVESYSLKTPEAVRKALGETGKALKEKVQDSRALGERLERGYRWESGVERPETPPELEEAARWNPHRIKADIKRLDEEAKALEYRRKALELRLKALEGDWKQVVVRWEER